jgi:predicted ATPase
MHAEPEPALPAREEDWSALKHAVKQFEYAWRQTPRPRIDDYLPIDEPLRSVVLVELVHIDLELRLKAGEAARVEEYLNCYTQLWQEPAVPLGLIFAEHELRRRRDPGLNLGEYLKRFPRYRTELADQIPDKTVFQAAPAQHPVDGAEESFAVPGFDMLERIGRGGMGVVYKARQTSLDRPVALKFLPEECGRDPIWLNRFRREARTASALNHPHICTIYDTGECAGRPFLSMELVEGKTLETLRSQRPPFTELVQLFRQAARALAAAHAAGVVHRDIKPANVMVRDDGIVKVLDFGLARRLPTTEIQPPTSSGTVTDAGTRVGTPFYMSPEQARAEAVDAATDIFSLGVVLYELATGFHPFSAESEFAVLHAIVAQACVPPARLNPEIPPALDALIQHMLAKNARLRPSAVEVEEALTQLTMQIPGQSASMPPSITRRPVVGRQNEWVALRAACAEAAQGRGLLICVTGEPGLGKTTLVDSFLDELAANGRNWHLARGRCSERLAGTEAYLPFLEALDNLLQGEGGASARQALKLLAPTWYVQIAPLAADDPSLARVFAEAKESSQERRKRELGVFLHEVSQQRPLVVFLDDVHWADPSSVDLLAYLGSKCSSWRLLLVLTYRSSELLRSQHPFGPVKLELQGRGICREIALPFLSRDDLDRYLTLAFAEHHFPRELASFLHARTEGNPLFMVDLLHYLRDRGVIVQDQGHWALARALPDLQRELPESVRGMIQRKLQQLSTADHQLLMAASVQGPEFDSVVVAHLLDRDPADVEERLEVLERVHMIVRLIREQTFADRTLTLRYGFVHVLYQNALYASLQPTRKAAWSVVAARALLMHHGEKSGHLAAELAMLFEAGRDHERAADHYQLAAENAARGFAHREAVALARRGLALLDKLPDSLERARRELPLQMTLGIQLQVVQGYAAPDAERTYDRACTLCEQVQEGPSLFLVLWGLWMYYEVGSNHAKSRELGKRLFALAEQAQDPALFVQARMSLAVASFSLGDPTATREHMEQAKAVYDPGLHSTHRHLYGQDPRVACLAFGAVALWLLGYPDQARARSGEAIALGRELGHPTTYALALYFDTMLHQYCHEAAAVQHGAEATSLIGAEHGLALWQANGMIMGGWARAEVGAWTDGVAQIRQGLTAWLATGAQTHRTYFLGLLAEALARGGQLEEGIAVLGEALAIMNNGTGTVFYAAELHRLRGEFLLQLGGIETGWPEAEACFQRARSTAREQQAKSLELRATMSLTRLYDGLNRQAEARPMLAECYGWFTEGFDTLDLQQARALLKAGC